MRTGLLGGAFNPPHNAHLELGRAALSVTDRVVFIPSGNPPHRRIDLGLSAQERLLFTRIATGQADGEILFDILREHQVFPSQSILENYLSLYRQYQSGLRGLAWEVSDLECALALRSNNPTFTIDTVRLWLEENPGDEIFLLLGADQAQALHTWKDISTLSGMVTFVVAARPGYDLKEAESRYPRVIVLEWEELDISSTQVRDVITRRGDLSEFIPQPLVNLLETDYYRKVFSHEE